MIAAQPIQLFLDGLAAAIASSAPGVARSLYVIGSQATGDAVASSDVDVCAIVHETAPASDVSRLVHVARTHAAARGRALDLAVMRETDLVRHGARAVAMRLGGRRFFGADLADDLPLPPLETYVAARMDDAACLVAFALRPPEVRLPLAYPDPNVEHYGYARATEPVMRDAVTVAAWAMTALVAQRDRIYVASKTAALSLYAQSTAPYASLASALSDRCRAAWAYGVPIGREREELGAICREMLAFERYFLGVYAEHLHARLSPRARGLASPSVILERALRTMLE